MCDGCLYWSDANLIGSHSTNEQCHILRSPWPFTSSCKSIEEYVGEISLHQFTCHFNLIHFLGEVPGELEQDDRIPTGGPSSPQFSCAVKRARVQKIYYDSGRKLKGLIDVAWPRSD